MSKVDWDAMDSFSRGSAYLAEWTGLNDQINWVTFPPSPPLLFTRLRNFRVFTKSKRGKRKR